MPARAVMVPMTRFAALAPILLLAACGRSSEAPGGVTANERKALDDAAEMLEKQRTAPGTIPSAPVSSVSASPEPVASGAN